MILPKMGESVAEATIIKWLKEEGDTIEADESIVEIATDKVDSEVPAPADGVLLKKNFAEDDVVKVGEVIAIIGGAEDATEGTPAKGAEVREEPVVAEPTPAGAPVAETAASFESISASSSGIEKTGPSGRFYSPLVRSIAKAEGIGLQELESITGSGREGRVTKKDILNYLPNRANGGAIVTASTPDAKPESTSVQTQAKREPVVTPAVSGQDEIIEMDRMRKLIADHMVMSKQTSPHVTSYVEADVTNIVNWRNTNKDKFYQREGEKLTYTPIFIEAVVRAIKDFPMINVSVSGNNIIVKKNINIGMATALPTGNLIVPVIKNADMLNMNGLARSVNDLATRARDNKLLPEEIQDGTYTVTNVGTFGNVMGTPIINQPQVAILALGAIRKKPAVIETPNGDFVGIRHMMFLSHAYDHRVVDGALGGSFVRRVADYLEQFDTNREA